MSSPSSSVTLDRLHPPVSRFSVNSQDGNASHSGIMKPILKHRSITEMLTSALPPTPIWATEDGILEEDEEDSESIDRERCLLRLLVVMSEGDNEGDVEGEDGVSIACVSR